MSRMNPFATEGFRTDLDEYFNVYKAGMTGSVNAKAMTPYMVIDEKEHKVIAVWHPRDVITLQDDTLILHAWPGRYRAEVWAMTVGQFKDGLNRLGKIDREPPDSKHCPVKQYNGLHEGRRVAHRGLTELGHNPHSAD